MAIEDPNYMSSASTNSLRATDSAEVNWDSPVSRNELWSSILPTTPPYSSIENIEEQTYYISHELNYKLDPLKSSSDISSIGEMAEYVLTDGEEANCNIASSILVASQPEYLNYATGYMVGAKQEVITARDAHAWAVDSAGHIYDPTPINGNADWAKPESQEAGSSLTDNTLPLYIIAAGGITGIAAWLQRRRLASASRRLKKLIQKNERVPSEQVSDTQIGFLSSLPYQTLAKMLALSDYGYMPEAARSSMDKNIKERLQEGIPRADIIERLRLQLLTPAKKVDQQALEHLLKLSRWWR